MTPLIDNTVLFIALVFLIVALNTLIVVSVTRLIFKIRISRQEIAHQVNEKISEEFLRVKTDEIKNSNLIQEEKPVEAEKEIKENKIIEEKEEHPKFLKFTPDGYIIPGSDVNEKKHVWR